LSWSDKLSLSDRAKYGEARRLSERGDVSGYTSLLLELVDSNPDVGILHAMAANGCWDLDEHVRAAVHFSRAVQLSPTTERISLGYFHFLLEHDLETEAEHELRRFLKGEESEEYRALARTLGIELSDAASGPDR